MAKIENESRPRDPALAGYDDHLGREWPESARWVHEIDPERMAQFRAELERLLPDKPKVVELLCREPRRREPFMKDVPPRMRAWWESLPMVPWEEGQVEVIFRGGRRS